MTETRNPKIERAPFNQHVSFLQRDSCSFRMPRVSFLSFNLGLLAQAHPFLRSLYRNICRSREFKAHLRLLPSLLSVSPVLNLTFLFISNSSAMAEAVFDSEAKKRGLSIKVDSAGSSFVWSPSSFNLRSSLHALLFQRTDALFSALTLTGTGGYHVGDDPDPRFVSALLALLPHRRNELELTLTFPSCLVRFFQDGCDLPEAFRPHFLSCSTGFDFRLHLLPYYFRHGRAELEESRKGTTQRLNGER